jgi:hypothetical protein
MLRFCLTLLAAVAVSTLAAAQAFDPPPVDEPALATRLADMTRPGPGERAIILYDPTYYPGITTRLREELHRRGVFTYVLVEETPVIIESYVDDETRHARQELDAIEALTPLFARADIFYWMPARAYVDDLRWERLVERTRVRSVHFHWLLPFPGNRTAEQIASESAALEQRALEVDLADHARRQERLAAAMRGRTLRITTPAGTHLSVGVRDDQWFHLGNGDASRKRAARARSIRDREIELPVGMFNFVPDASRVEGVLVADTIPRAGPDVRGARLVLRRGRVVQAEARQGVESIHRALRDIGPDGEKIATVWFNTHPMSEGYGLRVELGSNWENGGRNRAIGARRLAIGLPDATVAADGVVIVKDGRILWESIAEGRLTSPAARP